MANCHLELLRRWRLKVGCLFSKGLQREPIAGAVAIGINI